MVRFMEARYQQSAERARSCLESGSHDRSNFRAELRNIPSNTRDAWLDLVLGLDELPADGPELPAGCVPYLPCPVDTVVKMAELIGLSDTDVVIDVGAGVGRVAALVNLLTGASSIGIEIQPALAQSARSLAERLHLQRVSCVSGDASALTRFMMVGTVFFFYCPFSDDRLAKVIEDLKPIALTKRLSICCVDLPALSQPWLTRELSASGGLEIYRTVL